MKGVLTGLKNLKQVADNSNQKNGSSFLTIKDGQGVTLRFVQELDPQGKLYDDERGLAISVFEHTNPDDFSQRFLCTMEEEGKCYGCERVVTNPKWKRRSRLFISAFVKEDNACKIIGTGFSAKGVGGALIEYAEDFGTVCDRWYKLKRTGEGLKTSYSLYPRDVSDFDFDTVEANNLEHLAKYRTYEEVAALISGVDVAPTTEDW